MDAQLFEDVLSVVAGGMRANAECRRDGRVAEPGHQKQGDFSLSGSQAVLLLDLAAPHSIVYFAPSARMTRHLVSSSRCWRSSLVCLRSRSAARPGGPAAPAPRPSIRYPSRQLSVGIPRPGS